MKTQYILKLRDFQTSVVTDKPQGIYWNRGLQKEQVSINPVSLCRLFHRVLANSDEEIEGQAYNERAYPIEIDGYKSMTKQEFYLKAQKQADNELEKLDVIMEYEGNDKLRQARLELFEVLDYKL